MNCFRCLNGAEKPQTAAITLEHQQRDSAWMHEVLIPKARQIEVQRKPEPCTEFITYQCLKKKRLC